LQGLNKKNPYPPRKPGRLPAARLTPRPFRRRAGSEMCLVSRALRIKPVKSSLAGRLHDLRLWETGALPVLCPGRQAKTVPDMRPGAGQGKKSSLWRPREACRGQLGAKEPGFCPAGKGPGMRPVIPESAPDPGKRPPARGRVVYGSARDVRSPARESPRRICRRSGKRPVRGSLGCPPKSLGTVLRKVCRRYAESSAEAYGDDLNDCQSPAAVRRPLSQARNCRPSPGPSP
jgi:hypothetical protein